MLYFDLNRYGNGASIFTSSGVAARKFQTEIEAGQVKHPLRIPLIFIRITWTNLI